MESAVRGDGDAFARIIRRYQGVLARRMMRFTRCTRDVEELVHDVFVEAYFSLRTFRGDAPLEHWLQRIATRVGYRYWKGRRGQPTVSFQEQVHDRPAGDNAGATDDAADEVAILLDHLPPRDRLVLTLLYMESRSVAETAALAGWSQTMVKVQAYRARKKLRKLLLASRLPTSGGMTNERD
jgi:RNA polymerase sigma-70 factor (ECF subfamily)